LNNGDDDNPSLAILKKMEDLLMWEVRSVCTVAVGAPMFIIFEPAAYAIGAIGMVAVVVLDTYFSVKITSLFTLPISVVLGEGSGVVNQTQGFQHLLNSKWWTLVGSTLAVGSSTVLYVAVILQLVWGGPDKEMWKSWWMNVFVLWVNVNSILNTVGMLFVSGCSRGASLKMATKKMHSMLKKRSVTTPVGVLPGGRQTEFQADSQVSSQYTPNEVQG
jgi:hypothetical protein